MEPVLKPGQIIISDAWIYKDASPTVGDIVVIEHGVNNQILVKRINNWPNGERTKEGLWFITGDNSNASQDSRYFGGIASEQLIGKVKLILTDVNQLKKFEISHFLMIVN